MEEVGGVYPRTRVKMRREKQGLAERRGMGDNKRRMNREHAEAGKKQTRRLIEKCFLAENSPQSFFFFF